jgi:hypothetical protein
VHSTKTKVHLGFLNITRYRLRLDQRDNTNWIWDAIYLAHSCAGGMMLAGMVVLIDPVILTGSCTAID